MKAANKKFFFKRHEGGMVGDTSDCIHFCTYDISRHVNICMGRNGSICFDPQTAKEIAIYLAKLYDLIPDETVQTRKVVVDSNGKFIRFEEENEE